MVSGGNGDAGAPEPEEEWATLRDAASRYGVAVSTLRKWYNARGGDARVRSRMQDGPYGPQRVVNLADVAARIAGPTRAGASVTSIRPAPAGAPAMTPPDILPVPVDSWNKMLEQLGNLHQAGQEMATWQGRAMAAEARVEFLTTQLGDKRVETGELKGALREAYDELEGDRRTKGRRRWWHRLIGQGAEDAGASEAGASA